MIRVTYIDGQKFKYVYYSFEQKALELVNEYGQRELPKIEDIIKIEKQVKDLTLEETIKLNIYKCNQKKREVLVLIGYANDIPFGDIYKFDDYIDITEMVKRGVKR